MEPPCGIAATNELSASFPANPILNPTVHPIVHPIAYPTVHPTVMKNGDEWRWMAMVSRSTENTGVKVQGLPVRLFY
jgi:hypothetical protein